MHATVVEIGVSWHGNGASGDTGAESVKRHHVMDSKLDFAHSIIGRVVEFQWLMWLNEARTDIPIHLMSPNPGPGHGGMSCASPSKPTFSMAWRHNRNAKNAQSRAQTIQPNRSLLCTPKY